MFPHLRKTKILPTIRVKVKETDAEIIINVSDFNPKRFEPANAEEAAKLKPAAKPDTRSGKISTERDETCHSPSQRGKG